MSGSREARVAASAASAAGDHHALIRAREIVYTLAGVGIVDDRPDRDLQDNVRALAPGPVGTFAVASALRLVLGIEAEVDKGVVALAGFHDDVAAAAAVAARGPAARYELLAAEGEASVAAVASLYADIGFVDEHGRQLPDCQQKPMCLVRHAGCVRRDTAARAQDSYWSINR